MSKIWNSKDLTLDLVNIQSDSFSNMEIDMAKHIYEIIREQDYWKANPELCGLYDGSDKIGRLLPWAMRRGTTSRTLILSGHFDCVEIDCYGTLKEYALRPADLKEKMLEMQWSDPDVVKALKSNDWLFGRGVADMKGGTACALCGLFDSARNDINPELNILYIGVHDEETSAEGIFQTVGLLTEFKNKYDLEYNLLVNPEPTTRVNDKQYDYVDGSVGKILPCIVVKSKPAHVGNIMEGLNSTLIGANIVKNIELNKELCCEEFGQKTVPPTVLYMKDTKSEYNVSIPLYTEIFINLLFTKNNKAMDVFGKLREICEKSARESLNTFIQAYEYMKPSQECRNHEIKIFTFEELEVYCRTINKNYDKEKEEFVQRKIEEVKMGLSIIQTGTGFKIIEWAIEKSHITDPMIVLGLLPPYVPAVNNHYCEGFDREGVISIVENELSKFGLEMTVTPYFMGLSDNSYISCTHIEDDLQAMNNMVTPKDVYNPPLEEAGFIAVPSIIIGPWGKDYHTITERVYLPDLEIHTPAIIKKIIESI